MSMYMHHTVLDFSGVTSFWRTFCANVSKVSGKGEYENFGTISSTSHASMLMKPVPTSIADEQSLLRLAIDEQTSSEPHERSAADCYCDGTYSYTKTLPKETKCTQRLFIIPAARIREYRDQLRSHFPEDTPPTQCNVLAALVWTHATRARAARLVKNGYTETNIGIATDLRKRQQPPVPTTYTGNMALFSQGTLDIADLTAEDW